MDLATFGRIMLGQGLLRALVWAAENLAGLQLPVPVWAYDWVIAALGAGLNAAAAWVRLHFGVQKIGQRAPFLARVF